MGHGSWCKGEPQPVLAKPAATPQIPTMPLRDYTCRSCGKPFEALVKHGEDAPCPACGATDVERKVALFARPAGSDDAAPSFGGCGSCGDPRGPGACRLDS